MDVEDGMSGENRFGGFRRLVGDDGFSSIAKSSVCVIGVGGVGSWAVEALARSGIGHLTLVDFDDVCITNVNRQLHALSDTVGKAKVSVLRDRILAINPRCEVRCEQRFFTQSSCDEILGRGFSVVLDAIDRVTNKTLLIATCVKRGIPIVTTGSAGDRTDPTGIRVGDLSTTIHDPLLSYVRKRLRQKFDFPRGERRSFHVPAVYAPLQRNEAKALCRSLALESATAADTYDTSAPTEDSSAGRSCNSGLGTATYVTGSMGFFAAAQVIKLVTKGISAHSVPTENR